MPIGLDGSLCRIKSSAKDAKNNIVIIKVPENDDNNRFPYTLVHVGADEQEYESPSEKSDEEVDEKIIKDIELSRMLKKAEIKNSHGNKINIENKVVRSKEFSEDNFHKRQHFNINRNRRSNESRRDHINNHSAGKRNYSTSCNTAKSLNINASLGNINPWLSPGGPQLNQNYIYPQFAQSVTKLDISANTNNETSVKNIGLLGDSPFSPIPHKFQQTSQNTCYISGSNHWNNEYDLSDYQSLVPPSNLLDRSVSMKQIHPHGHDYKRSISSTKYAAVDGPVSKQLSHPHDYKRSIYPSNPYKVMGAPVSNQQSYPLDYKESTPVTNSFDTLDQPVSMNKNHPHDYERPAFPINSYEAMDGPVSMQPNHPYDYKRSIHPINPYKVMNGLVSNQQIYSLDYKNSFSPTDSYDTINQSVSMNKNHPHDCERPVFPTNSYEALDGPVSMQPSLPIDYERSIHPINPYKVMDGLVSNQQIYPLDYKNSISSTDSYDTINQSVSMIKNHPHDCERPVFPTNSYEAMDGTVSIQQDQPNNYISANNSCKGKSVSKKQNHENRYMHYKNWNGERNKKSRRWGWKSKRNRRRANTSGRN